MELKGVTPAEKAELKIKLARNKLLSLIRYAYLTIKWQYPGVDLHKLTAVVTALDDSGNEVLHAKYPNTRDGWDEFHSTFPDGGQVAIESVLNHMEVYDLLESWGFEVSVAH